MTSVDSGLPKQINAGSPVEDPAWPLKVEKAGGDTKKLCINLKRKPNVKFE